MLTIARSHQVGTALGLRRAVELAVRPQLAWHRQAAGAGDQRCYHWALIGLQLADSDDDRHGGQHALLGRRHRRTSELACSPHLDPLVPLSALATGAGRRRTSAEAGQAGNGLTALDAHQVRRRTCGRRPTVLAMLAHAFLAVTATSTTSTSPTATLTRLTCAQPRRLLHARTAPPTPTISHVLPWSRWRRHAQARARTSHYQRQTPTE